MTDRIEIERAISAAFAAVIGRDPCDLHPVDAVPLARPECRSEESREDKSDARP